MTPKYASNAFEDFAAPQATASAETAAVNNIGRADALVGAWVKADPTTRGVVKLVLKWIPASRQ